MKHENQIEIHWDGLQPVVTVLVFFSDNKGEKNGDCKTILLH